MDVGDIKRKLAVKSRQVKGKMLIPFLLLVCVGQDRSFEMKLFSGKLCYFEFFFLRNKHSYSKSQFFKKLRNVFNLGLFFKLLLKYLYGPNLNVSVL